MDAIKNKMKSLKSETENALTRANQLDTEAKGVFRYYMPFLFSVF